MTAINTTRICLAKHAIRGFSLIIMIVAALFAFAVVASASL